MNADQPDHLHISGVVYPLSDWLTQTVYAEKYSLNQKTLWGMISRGLLASTDVLEVPSWNLKLLRDVPPPETKRGPKPTTKARYEAMRSDTGKWYLYDRVLKEIVYSVDADSQAQAIDRFSRDGYNVDRTEAGPLASP